MSFDPRGSLRRAVGRTKRLLRRAFDQQHSTERVARSFSLGLFVAMLPTVGIGPSILLGLSTLVDRLNRLALIASVAVCNPLVKPAIYVASLAVGFGLLGPVEGASITDASLAAAPDVVVRLLLGNVILAVVVAVPGYVLAHRTVDHYRKRDTAVA